MLQLPSNTNSKVYFQVEELRGTIAAWITYLTTHHTAILTTQTAFCMWGGTMDSFTINKAFLIYALNGENTRNALNKVIVIGIVGLTWSPWNMSYRPYHFKSPILDYICITLILLKRRAPQIKFQVPQKLIKY